LTVTQKRTGRRGGSVASTRDWARLTLHAYLAALVFLAPLKLGNAVVSTEISLLPVTFWEWLMSPFPAWMMPIGTGIALALSVASTRRVPRWSVLWALPLAWCALFVSALVGLLRTSEWDMALQLAWHLLGIACFAVAVFVTVADDPRVTRWLCGALVAGSLWSGAGGWHQWKWGLDATREFILDKHGALPIGDDGRPPPIIQNLEQKRVFGAFVYPNSYAAHLILVGPCVLLLLWRLGRHFEPVNVSRALFLGTGVFLLVGALALSQSRAGIAALGGACVFGVLRFPRFRAWRMPAGVGCVLVMGLLMVAVNRGRSLSSIEARGEYYRCATLMFAEHPGTGVGLGEFFPQYIRMKSLGAEETRQPHNMILGYAAQAGLLAGLAACFCYLLPLAAAPIFASAGKKVDETLLRCVEIGMAAWFLHALVDFNCQVAGTTMLVAAFPFLALLPEKSNREPPAPSRLPCVVLALAALLCCGAAWRWPGELAYRTFYDAVADPKSSGASLRQQAAVADRLLRFSPYPWLVYGKVAERNGDFGAAELAYEAASRAAPHRAAFYARRARVLAALGRGEEARRALAMALDWYPLNQQYRAAHGVPESAPRGAEPEP